MRYATIVADPPWRYQGGSPPSGRRDRKGDPSHFYATMSDEEIRDLPVSTLAADTAHLYMWVTNTRIFECNAVGIVEAWGFEFKTLLTWHKTGPLGLGRNFRIQTEHVLFCARGKIGIPPSVRVPNVFMAPRRGHSEKPDSFYDLVERVSPGPYLELFARRARFGWDYWGNESLETVEMPSGL